MKNNFVKINFVIAILTLSLQAFAGNPTVSDTALNYSADQSVQPVATHTPLSATYEQTAPHLTAKHHTRSSKHLRQLRHKTHHHHTHQK